MRRSKALFLLAIVILLGWQPNASGNADYSSNLAKRIALIDFKDMEMPVVMKFLSQKSGINFISSQGCNMRVNVYLSDVSVEEALNIIVKMNRLAYIQDENAVMVMTRQEYEEEYGYPFGKFVDTRVIALEHINTGAASELLGKIKSESGVVIPETFSRTLVITDQEHYLDKMERVIKKIDRPLTSESFILKYAEASEIATKLDKILTSSVGTLEYDEATSSLVVTDTKDVIKKVEEYIKLFDKRQPEVSIESKIIQVTLSDEHKLGVNWQTIVPDYHDLTFESDLSVLTSTEKFGRAGIGTFADDNYTAMIEALETIGDTKILSNPHITALNRQEAKILVGSTEPYVTSTTTTPSSGPTTVSESVNFIEVGVKLYATPTIHSDGYITMKIKPEVSSVTRNVVTANNNTIPVVETSEAETTVMIADGATIVIGGLIRDERVNTSKMVPVLGKIPILGVPFRSEDFLDRTTEIVIFLTPRIISGQTQDFSKYSHILQEE